jgi:hypothetical protein
MTYSETKWVGFGPGGNKRLVGVDYATGFEDWASAQHFAKMRLRQRIAHWQDVIKGPATKQIHARAKKALREDKAELLALTLANS